MGSNYHAKLQLRNFLLWHPELELDEEAKTIAIESETQFLEIVEESLDHIATMEARIERLDLRKKLWLHRLDKERKQLLEILEITGHKKAQADGGTVWIGYGPSRLILDREEYPEAFMERVPDKKAIRQHLLDGGKLDGAVISDNREPYLIIKDK